MAGEPVSRTPQSTRHTHPFSQRHFTLQHSRPPTLIDVELQALDPALRVLLFTDGTVTRTLEAQGLSRVRVNVIDQTHEATPADVAELLDVNAGEESVRRRVTISADARPRPLIWAESHILAERLPAGFLSVLHDTPDGIGESLQQVRLESWRDMLWFGLSSPPRWSEADSQTLTRLYRVITGHRPALLISESIAVAKRGDAYHLA